MNAMLTADHCSGCGQPYDFGQTVDGYTDCCNEGVCGGVSPGCEYTYAATHARPAFAGDDSKEVVAHVQGCCTGTATAGAADRELRLLWRVLQA